MESPVREPSEAVETSENEEQQGQEVEADDVIRQDVAEVKGEEGRDVEDHEEKERDSEGGSEEQEESGEGAREEEEEEEAEEDDGEDEDVLLDQFVSNFKTRLSGISLVAPRGGPAETSGRPAVAGTTASNQSPASKADSNGFVLLDEGAGPGDDEVLAASLAKIKWAPETGLPIEHSEGGDELAWEGESAEQGQLGRGPHPRGSQKQQSEDVQRGGTRKGPKLGTRQRTEFRVEAGLEKKLVAPLRDPRKEAREAKKAGPQTAGFKWFDLPATQITPELKTELRLLKLRGVLDPKRHYKAPDATKFPKHFQIGTVVEGPTHFYSGRLTNKERKTSFAAELLADPALKQYRKRKYMEIQAEKDLASKRHYKKQKDKRKPAWARS